MQPPNRRRSVGRLSSILTMRRFTFAFALTSLALSGCAPTSGHLLWTDRQPIQPGSLEALEGIYASVGEYQQCSTPEGGPCRVAFDNAIGGRPFGSTRADTTSRLEVRVLDPNRVSVSIRAQGRLIYEEVLRGHLGADGYFHLATESRARLTPAVIAWTLRRSFSRLGRSGSGALLLESDVSAILFVTVLPAFGGWHASSYSFERVDPTD